ncbi:sensor histidine kinase [Nocardiopsis sp. YSL2]|uniref:sensor histidine kinase n=1 Tax=Nocardiopsis sp. YSL2 TaxID=2939492 RepID=UPI0026F443F2|nr:sensor histidine kinase [Nocardiopsis sp. YSL2]
MTPLLERFDLRRLDFRGDCAPVGLRYLFWTTVVLIIAVRTILAQAEGRFVPTAWPHPEWVFVLLLGALAPLCLLWPFLPWESSAPAHARVATLGFLASAAVLMPVTDFAVYPLVALAIANAACVFGAVGGLIQSALFSAVNVLVGALHPDLPPAYALTNGGLLFLYCLAVLFVMTSLLAAGRRARRTRELLAELDDAHRRLRAYAARAREATISEERGRMAREMHDSTGHYLTSIHLCLANAERTAAALPTQVREDLRQARRLTKEALADTRRWVRALKPLDLAHRSGPEAIGALTDAFSDMGITTVFTATGAWPEEMEGELELVAYRVVQEALTNALRHGRAERVEVAVHAAQETVTLRVSDDGQGGAEDMADGFGLTALRERLAALGGSLSAGNRPEGGFELCAQIPMGVDRGVL